jgi:hypothetical protein
MTTIIISEGITATLSDRKAAQYRKAVAVSQSCREAFLSHEWDWKDLALWEEEEWQAWEEFFS